MMVAHINYSLMMMAGRFRMISFDLTTGIKTTKMVPSKKDEANSTRLRCSIESIANLSKGFSIGNLEFHKTGLKFQFDVF